MKFQFKEQSAYPTGMKAIDHHKQLSTLTPHIVKILMVKIYGTKNTKSKIALISTNTNLSAPETTVTI